MPTTRGMIRLWRRKSVSLSQLLELKGLYEDGVFILFLFFVFTRIHIYITYTTI